MLCGMNLFIYIIYGHNLADRLAWPHVLLAVLTFIKRGRGDRQRHRYIRIRTEAQKQRKDRYHIQQDEQKRRAAMHINHKPGEQVEVE